MKTAVIEINPEWKAALKAGAKGIRQAAKSGRVQQATFSYASPELLFSEISPKRWGVLEAMSGAGEMSLRELARRREGRRVRAPGRAYLAGDRSAGKNREWKNRVSVRQGAGRFHAGTGGIDRNGGVNDDIWFAKDINHDGDLLDAGEGVARWASNGALGSEFTGLFFDPNDPNKAYVGPPVFIAGASRVMVSGRAAPIAHGIRTVFVRLMSQSARQTRCADSIA